MTNIENTYLKLRNGDKYLTNILDEIIEYRATNGKKSKHVANILEYQNNATISVICTVLVLTALVPATHLYYFLKVDAMFPLLILIVILGFHQIITYVIRKRKYFNLFNDYTDINYILNTMPENYINEMYWKYHSEDDGRE